MQFQQVITGPDAPMGEGPKKEKELIPWAQRLTWFFSRLNRLLIQIFSNLTFGDGTDSDNLLGAWVTFTSSATPDAENTVAHNLGIIPVGFILMIPPKSGYIYNGSTTWTTTNIYLKCTAASQAVTIFVLLPPPTS